MEELGWNLVGMEWSKIALRYIRKRNKRIILQSDEITSIGIIGEETGVTATKYTENAENGAVAGVGVKHAEPIGFTDDVGLLTGIALSEIGNLPMTCMRLGHRCVPHGINIHGSQRLCRQWIFLAYNNVLIYRTKNPLRKMSIIER